MDPITIASIVGAGLAGGIGGFLAGSQRSEEEPVEKSTSPPQADPRLDELDRENRALRRLTGLQAPKMIGDNEPFGPYQEFLETRLADLIASNSVRAAAFLDSDGLVLAGSDRTPGVEGLAAVFSTLVSIDVCDEPTARIVWTDHAGNRFEFHRVSQVGRKPLYLGVWTLSVQPSPAAISRIKYACSGLSAIEPTPNDHGRTVTATSEAERALFESITTELDVYNIGIIGTQGTVAKLEAPTATRVEDNLTSALRVITRLGLWVDELGTDTQQLRYETMGGRVLGFHPFDSADGSIALLYLEVGADVTYPEDHMERWIGQIAWRLPKVEPDSDSDAEQPKTAAGGRA